MTLAEVHWRRGGYENARKEIEHAIAIQRASLPDNHVDHTWSQVTLAKIKMRTGALGEAESDLCAALQKLSPLFSTDHPGMASVRGALGECLVLENRYAEAEPLLLKSHTVFQKRMGSADSRTQAASTRLVDLYEAWGKPEQAAQYRPK